MDEIENLLVNFHQEIKGKGKCNFTIDIGCKGEIDVQIIHPANVVEAKLPVDKQQLGFVIYLPFDLSDENNKSRWKKMNYLENLDLFESFVYDGIPCYSYYQKDNIHKIHEMLNIILTKVYSHSSDQKYFFHSWIGKRIY